MSNPRTIALINKLNSLDGCVIPDTALEDAARVIHRGLQEQDRDARHACAEAVAALDDCAPTHPDLPDRVHVHDAAAACINARTRSLHD